MSSDTSTAQGYEKYYVPESSSLAVRATIGLILSVFGAGLVLNDMTFGAQQESSTSVWVLTAGLVFFVLTLASWFGTVIKENLAGMNSGQLNQSYVLGMFWFIFSEVMFFAAFFGALLYVRQFVGPWLAGEGDGGRMNGLLWPGFEFTWPPVTTPQEVVGGVDAQAIANNGAFVSQQKSMAPADAHAWYAWLPMWNTLILLSSSATVHVAHTALLADDRSKFNRWLGITVGLALVFLGLQAAEYYEAYALYGLTLNSGIYGSTFFMLTGFHGFHVAMGMTMLLIQLVRSLRKQHFTATDHFGFEASSWYWHFVDVVWVFLFLFVYIL
ncbi:MAG: cytochrome c oxidase subunit 3 [Halieaceae bacterium]|jgi:cytochrome c oxidase subunit 3